MKHDCIFTATPPWPRAMVESVVSVRRASYGARNRCLLNVVGENDGLVIIPLMTAGLMSFFHLSIEPMFRECVDA